MGASMGIGKVLAVEFSKQEAIVIISSRNTSQLNEVKQECDTYTPECFVLPLDLTKPENFNEKTKTIISKYQKIDFLIINGGVSQRSYITETALDIDRKIMEINYFGNIALTKSVLPYMLQQKTGHIATVSSIVGVFGFPLRSAYSASKHALHGFYETLRAEHYSDNIKVSVIIPGRVKTNISINALTKEGKAYGKNDDGQAGGITAEKAAICILKGIRKEKKEILVGRKELIMVYLRRYLPFVFYRIVNKIKTT